MTTSVSTNPTKNTALVLGATGNLTFALAVVLQGLKKYNQPLLQETDLFIYYQDMDPAARQALAQIVPCQFIEYHFPYTQRMIPQVLKQYGELSFARYECFRYLKKYSYVIWLDADLLIRGDISGMRQQIPHGIGFRREYYNERVQENFTRPVEGFDMNAPHFNSGVFVASKNLPANPDELSDWCYQQTEVLNEVLRFPDQGILLLMCQHFGLTIDPLDETYNCEAQRNFWALRKAAVIHAVGHRKFWKYYYFKDWFNAYKSWVRKTGIRCQNNVPFFKKWKLEKYPLFQVAPDPIKYPGKFLTYLLRWFLGACI